MKELIKFRADSLLRRAIRMRAAIEDRDMQDVIVNALSQYLREELNDLKRRGFSEEEPAASAKRTKKSPGGTGK